LSRNKHRNKNNQSRKIINGIIKYNRHLQEKSALTTVVKKKIAIRDSLYLYLKPAPKKKEKPWNNKEEMKAYKKQRKKELQER